MCNVTVVVNLKEILVKFKSERIAIYKVNISLWIK